MSQLALNLKGHPYVVDKFEGLTDTVVIKDMNYCTTSCTSRSNRAAFSSNASLNSVKLPSVKHVCKATSGNLIASRQMHLAHVTDAFDVI